MVARRGTPAKTTEEKVAEKLEENAMVKSTGNNVENYVKVLDRDLREIKTVEDAMAFAQEQFGDVINVEDLELGNGFTLTRNKDLFLGVPLLILNTKFQWGDWDDFVTVMGITTDARQARFIFNDGSTGFCEQMRDVIAQHNGRNGGFMLNYGLRKSTYDTCPGPDGCGKPLPNKGPNGDITHCDNCDTEVGSRRGKGATFYIRQSADESLT